MTPSQAVRTLLLSLSGVTALVGTRVRVLTLAQSDAQAGRSIRIQQIGETEFSHLRGSVGLFKSRLQVDLYSPVGGTYEDLAALEAVVHGDGAGSGLGHFHGAIGGFIVDVTLPSGRQEMYEGEELRQARISRDYVVHHR